MRSPRDLLFVNRHPPVHVYKHIQLSVVQQSRACARRNYPAIHCAKQAPHNKRRAQTHCQEAPYVTRQQRRCKSNSNPHTQIQLPVRNAVQQFRRPLRRNFRHLTFGRRITATAFNSTAKPQENHLLRTDCHHRRRRQLRHSLKRM